MRASWVLSSLLVFAACTGGETTPDGPSPDCVGCGASSAARLEADRSMVDFGSVAVSTTSPVTTVQISNTGMTTSGTITPVVAGQSAAEFVVTNGCTTLSRGGTCVVTVSFKPTMMGQKIGELWVTGSPGGSIKVTLIGTAN